MDFVEQLKSSVDIVSVMGEYVRLRRSGANRYMGLCPFHNEKSPSFTVHVVHQFYKCFSCGAGGDVVKFVMEKEGISFYEALKSLSERYGIPMPKRSQYADDDSKLRGALLAMHELAAENFRANLKSQAGDAARAYIAKRGLAPETVEHFGLGYSDRSGRALVRLFEQRGFPVAQMEAVGPRRQAAGWQPLRPLSQPPDVSDSQRIRARSSPSAAARCPPKTSPSISTRPKRTSTRRATCSTTCTAPRKASAKTIAPSWWKDTWTSIGVTAAGFRQRGGQLRHGAHPAAGAGRSNATRTASR